MSAGTNLPDMRAVGLSGSPERHGSRSRLLLELALTQLDAAGIEVEHVDLSALDASALLGRTRDPYVDAALAALASARLVVVATPVYRATYSGLLKVFLDLLPNGALAGQVALPIATGGSMSHQLALDHGLRPLLASLGALVVPTGVYASPEYFLDGYPDRVLTERLERAVAEALALARFAPSPTDSIAGARPSLAGTRD